MTIPSHCSVLIIGAGPAGLFCAERLHRAGVRGVVVIDRGTAMTRRVCPESSLCTCHICDVLEGEGGAGSFSDGKITLSLTRGTHGQELFQPDDERLLTEIEKTILNHVPKGVHYEGRDSAALDTGRRQGGLVFDPYPLLHVGSDGIRAFGANFARALSAAGVTILTGVEATELLVDRGAVTGAVLRRRRDGQPVTISTRTICMAAGLAGTTWAEQQLSSLGVTLETGSADIGIRLETGAGALAPFIDAFYDFKASIVSGAGLNVRSFCVNGDGFVVNEYHQELGIRGVNGHSFLDRRSGLSNLAILATVDTTFTADPKQYVRSTAAALNAGAEGYPPRQTLAEFAPAWTLAAPVGVQPSNPKTRPAPLAALLPDALRAAFEDYIRALSTALPPVLAADSVLYGPEIKYYTYQVPISRNWESVDVPGLFVLGNAAGYTASLSAAALSGIIAGRAIAARAADPPARGSRP